MKRNKKFERKHRQNEKFAKKIKLEVWFECGESEADLHLSFLRKGVVFNREISWEKLLKRSLAVDFSTKREIEQEKKRVADSMLAFIKNLEIKTEKKKSIWKTEPPKSPRWAITYSEPYQFHTMYWNGSEWKNKGKSDFYTDAVTHWQELPPRPQTADKPKMSQRSKK